MLVKHRTSYQEQQEVAFVRTSRTLVAQYLLGGEDEDEFHPVTGLEDPEGE
jgi:hypothetical protein